MSILILGEELFIPLDGKTLHLRSNLTLGPLEDVFIPMDRYWTNWIEIGQNGQISELVTLTSEEIL
jgi:hypothetical protein